MLLAGVLQTAGGHAFVGHQQQHAGGCDDARERRRERADEHTCIDDCRCKPDVRSPREVVEGSIALVERDGRAGEAHHLAVAADDEEDAREDGAANHRARNRLQRVLRFGAQRRCTLEADEAEDGQHHPQAHATRGRPAQQRAYRKLPMIEMPAMLHQRHADNDGDQHHGDSLDVEHHPRGDLHVAIGDPCCRRCCNRDEDHGGERARKMRGRRDAVEEHKRELEEAADHRRGRRDVRAEERPCRDGRARLGQRALGVDVQRAWRGGLARERGHAEPHEDHQHRRHHIRDGRALAREREDQRNRRWGRGAGRDGGDRLRQRLQRRKRAFAQAVGGRERGLGAVADGCGLVMQRHTPRGNPSVQPRNTRTPANRSDSQRTGKLGLGYASSIP